MMLRARSLLFAVFGAVLLVASAAADEVTGLYDVKGEAPGGKGYQGAVQIVDLGSAQAILWKLSDGEGYKGLAIRQGNVLGAAYGVGQVPFGLIVYKINGGKLDGQWISSGDPKAELGREQLDGPSGLDGEYQITLGENRDGTTNYTGKVVIKPEGDTFLVAWMVPKLAYLGRGVRVGDVLVVAWGRNPKRLPGVVGYQIKDANTLGGIWAAGGSSKTGSETLKRHAP